MFAAKLVEEMVAEAMRYGAQITLRPVEHWSQNYSYIVEGKFGEIPLIGTCDYWHGLVRGDDSIQMAIYVSRGGPHPPVADAIFLGRKGLGHLMAGDCIEHRWLDIVEGR